VTERQSAYVTSRRHIEIPNDFLVQLLQRQRVRARLLNAAVNALPILGDHAPALANQLATAIEEYQPGTLKARHVDDAPAIARKGVA
jgi:hypothetical protein